MNLLANFQRSALISFGRMVNTSVDRIFYDVGTLTRGDKKRLGIRANPEGSVLIVYPKSDTEDIERYTPLEFIRKQKEAGSQKVDALVVAGVGSSARGTAALARNVADYLGRPVAGIVSGMGLADVFSEAMGGWFVFGTKNRIRNYLAHWFDLLGMQDHVWDDISYDSLVKDKALSGFDMNRLVFGSPDSVALLLTLYHLGDQIKLLVGHSKGNYNIVNALDGLVALSQLKKKLLPEELRVVTLGAVVRFPKEFENQVHQFLGELDGLGVLNSRAGIDYHQMPGTWHSLNTLLSGHMAVDKVLQLAGAS